MEHISKSLSHLLHPLAAGLDEQTVEVTGFAPGEWSWANQRIGESANGETVTLAITTTGVYTLNLFMREDGLRIDRLLLTTDTTFIPTGFGPAETERQLGGGPLIVPITRTIVYTYDNLYRLTATDYTSGENYQYSYDPVGNRLQQIIDGDTTTYQYDAANRLWQVAGQNYTFDDNGNLLQTGVMTNSWDAANRLIETERAGTTLEPIYNGVGDRVGQTVGLSTTNYALDVAGGLPEVIYTSEGNAYLHLPGVIVAESSTGDIRYLLSDGLGSVRQAVDETATLVSYHEFDPYGNPVEGGGEPYGYTGEWWEDDVGLLHLRARWYLPETGTFLSRDAFQGDDTWPATMNGYNYVHQNSINWIDPSGYVVECNANGYCPTIDRWLCWKTWEVGWGAYDNRNQPCIVNPDNVQTGNAPSMPPPPPLPSPPPPPPQRPEESESSDDCPFVPEVGMTRCEKFVQEVRQIISLSKVQGLTDAGAVMILAKYYSNINLQTNQILEGMLLPGNPATPQGYFRSGQEIERYPVIWPGDQDPTIADMQVYGFRTIFWHNTHHYFADFYHTYFLGDNIGFAGAYIREIKQLATGENSRQEFSADTEIHWVAKRHVHQITRYTTAFGPYVAPLLPGRIEILPSLLSTDACLKMSEILAGRW